MAGDLGRRMEDFAKMFPVLTANLSRRAHGDIADVSKSVERTTEEIDDLIAANHFQSRDSLAFKEYRVGIIRGFRFPIHDWSMSSGLRKLFNELNKFSDLKPRTLQMVDLQRWAHWAEDFDSNLARTMVGIEDGMNFFSVENFQLFSVLEQSDEKKKQLRSLQIHDICQSRTATPSQQQKPLTIRRTKPKPHISAKTIRRLTGDKKAR